MLRDDKLYPNNNTVGAMKVSARRTTIERIREGGDKCTEHVVGY